MTFKTTTNKEYTLVDNGVQKSDKELKLIFFAYDLDFEEVESDIIENPTPIYMYDNNTQIQSIVGYTNYKGMQKINNYYVGNEVEKIVDEETQEEKEVEVPIYDTVFIITLDKASQATQIDNIEETVSIILANQLEGGIGL